MDKAENCSTLPFWDELSTAEQARVMRESHVRHYEAGSIIHARDHECLGLIHVIAGSVRSFMLSEEGREITLYEMGPNDIDVLSAACVVSQITFETQLVASSDCDLLVVPASCLSTLKQDNLMVRCFIFEKLGERFSDAMQVMQDMLFVPLERRVSQYLLDLADEQGPDIHTTHEAIATKLNSSREVISRTLKRMEREGWVSLGRQSIHLCNSRQLAQL